MNKLKVIITKSISILVYLVTTILIIISLCNETDWENPKAIAAIIGLCALARFLVYFINLDYLKRI